MQRIHKHVNSKIVISPLQVSMPHPCWVLILFGHLRMHFQLFFPDTA